MLEHERESPPARNRALRATEAAAAGDGDADVGHDDPGAAAAAAAGEAESLLQAEMLAELEAELEAELASHALRGRPTDEHAAYELAELEAEAEMEQEAEREREAAEWAAAEAAAAERSDRDAAAEEEPSEPQYVEDGGVAASRWVQDHPVLRLFARHRRVDLDGQRTTEVDGEEGVLVAMEAREVQHISTSGAREMLRLLLALHSRYVFTHAWATDGSYEAGRSSETFSPPAAAWGAWDGREAIGGRLPPGGDTYAAELEAVRQVLRRAPTGARVLLLVDCHSAMQAIETAWRAGTFAALRRQRCGALVEAIVRERLRIGGTADGGGHVVFVYAPAHGGGISPNAYADAVAKAHLGEQPAAEPKLLQLVGDVRCRRLEPSDDTGVRSRLCVYALQDAEEGGWWRGKADTPVYPLARQLLERWLRREMEHDRPARYVIDDGWRRWRQHGRCTLEPSLLRAAVGTSGVGTSATPSAAGRSLG